MPYGQIFVLLFFIGYTNTENIRARVVINSGSAVFKIRIISFYVNDTYVIDIHGLPLDATFVKRFYVFALKAYVVLDLSVVVQHLSGQY